MLRGFFIAAEEPRCVSGDAWSAWTGASVKLREPFVVENSPRVFVTSGTTGCRAWASGLHCALHLGADCGKGRDAVDELEGELETGIGVGAVG